MREYLIDVPVLILFFNRAENLREVFNQVRQARPSKLFLYQDGPRKGRDDDQIGITACREIVEDIDWDCEVHRKYQTINYGCDPSEYLSQKWAFSFVDKCIILEDDDVPSLSFFQFCKELLDKYEYNDKVSMIAGMNHEEITKNIEEDYFFTRNVSIWGWATWRRVVDQWDAQYSYMNTPEGRSKIKYLLKSNKYRHDYWSMLKKHSESGVAYYETIHMSYMLMNDGLSIVPTKNMIRNIGYRSGTHSDNSFSELPLHLKKIYTLNTYEIRFPLKHPKSIIDNNDYKNRVYKMMGWNDSVVKKMIKRVVKKIKRMVRNAKS